VRNGYERIVPLLRWREAKPKRHSLPSVRWHGRRTVPRTCAKRCGTYARQQASAVECFAEVGTNSSPRARHFTPLLLQRSFFALTAVKKLARSARTRTMLHMPDTGKHLLKDLFTLALLIVVVVIPIRLFVVSPFVVDGESMHPTFENLDYLIVDEIIYDFRAPARGDVIVFRYPGDPSIFYIKRIIGLPGETVSIQHGDVTITKTDGSTLTLSEPYVVNEDATYSKSVTLGPDEFFVMGDNRPNSSDSRVWGPLPRKNIIGRVDVRLLPIGAARFMPGETSYTPQSAASTTLATP
jgi:signal peptidase I